MKTRTRSTTPVQKPAVPVQSRQQVNAKAEALAAKMTTEQVFEALKMIQPGNTDHQQVAYWLRGVLLDRNICPDGQGALDNELNCKCCK